MAKLSGKISRPDKMHPVGRPSDAYRIWCERQVMARKRLQAIEKTIQDPDSKHFATMNIHLDDLVVGKPKQQVEVQDTTPPVRPAADSVRDLLNALPALLARFPDQARTLTAYEHAQKLLAAGFTPVEVEG